MKSLNRLCGFALVASGATLVQFASPVQAAVFDFTTGSSSNSATKTYSASGITLVASDSNATASNSNAGTLNGPGTVSPLGLCAWTVVAGGFGRCGYGSANGAGVSSFQLKFDKAVSIESFVVGINELSSGSIGFSLDNSVFSTVSFNTAGTKTLASLFAAAANQTIYVQTTGTPSGSNGGLIRLGSLNTIEQTPAPLPLLGAALGFRVSRRIRKRIGLAARQA